MSVAQGRVPVSCTPTHDWAVGLCPVRRAPLSPMRSAAPWSSGRQVLRSGPEPGGGCRGLWGLGAGRVVQGAVLGVGAPLSVCSPDPGPPQPQGLDVQRLGPRRPPSCAPSWRTRGETGRVPGPASHRATAHAPRACRTRLLGPRPQHRPPGAWASRLRAQHPAAARLRWWAGPRRPQRSGRRAVRARSGQAVPGGRAGQRRGASWVWTGLSIFRVLRPWGRRLVCGRLPPSASWSRPSRPGPGHRAGPGPGGSAARFRGLVGVGGSEPRGATASFLGGAFSLVPPPLIRGAHGRPPRRRWAAPRLVSSSAWVVSTCPVFEKVAVLTFALWGV